jgi:hypothetical protein
LGGVDFLKLIDKHKVSNKKPVPPHFQPSTCLGFRALGIVLLKGLRRRQFLMSEVSLYGEAQGFPTQWEPVEGEEPLNL